MCLIVKRPVKIQTAKENMVVYKLVEEHKSYLNTGLTSLYGPFQWIKYGIVKCLPFSIREDDKFHITPCCFYFNTDMITGGGFHTFKNLLDAVACNKTMFSQYTIYKCIIPKGIQYIEGIFIQRGTKRIEEYSSYVSKELRFEEKCV